MAVSSTPSIPGSGYCVVNGYAPTWVCEPVSAACSADLPVLGGPTIATCAAPSGWMNVGGPLRAPPFDGPASSSLSSLIFVLMSARRCSVPLCFGIVRCISWRRSRRSFGSRARL